MIRTLALATLVIATGCASSEDADPTTSPAAVEITAASGPGADAADASVIALVFAADWCSKCKELDPKLDAVRARVSEDLPIDFVRLDYTDDGTTAEAATTAESLGVSDLFAENDGATGHIVLVSSATGEVIDRIAASDSEEAMERKLQTAATV